MKRMMLAGLITIAIALPATTGAQDDAAVAFAYVTYFECNPATEYRADENIERSFKPHYDAAVEAGTILSWSWLGHFVGAKWRRALVLTAGNMNDLLDAAGALGEAIAESTPESGRVFTEVCPVHEDYIWETVPGVGGTAAGQERGDVGFSVYIECDVNREERVDELMQETLGQIYDQQVADGNLATWTWLRHNVGGDYRRLLSLTGADHKGMMRTRAAILEQIRSGRSERAFNQMNDICPKHTDYMGDIVYETP